MLKLRAAESNDRSAWDAYVLTQPDAAPYHLWAWRRTVELAYDHAAHYLLAEEGGQLVGVLPLFHLRALFFLNELTALPFCDVGNCLASSPQVKEALVQRALALARQLKCRSFCLRGKLEESVRRSAGLQLEASQKLRMVLSLPDSSEVLLAGFKSKLRSQIRKAEKNGLEFSWARGGGIKDFYTVYARNMRDLGSPPHSRQWFDSVATQFGERARIGLVTFEGKCIGAGLIICTDQQVAIPWASTLREYNRLSPNMLLYWNLLKFSADKGYRVFDFGRSTEGEGTYRFKRQWGAEDVPLCWYSLPGDYSPGTRVQRNGRKGRDLLAATWKRFPVPVSNFMGSLMRGYISL
ncbi:FemAB family XrtA/PEP-CTERM system-associated protein [Desulfogranum mediterraneum]|uniref:FemAB family XrtA/PEP-CTERM system-associated protein n=1 Tax=Desulfogranum mediterraneum TaxID=160661 RepID=UPI0004009188|nr:FemAB family XrtA/PEP-CTERM system-associated protein [Desulfogranum mediterraneum]